MATETNPIVEYYRGKTIRKYNVITIRVSIPEFKRFIDYKDDFGLSCRDSILQKGILCAPCNKPTIVKFNNAQSH